MQPCLDAILNHGANLWNAAGLEGLCPEYARLAKRVRAAFASPPAVFYGLPEGKVVVLTQAALMAPAVAEALGTVAATTPATWLRHALQVARAELARGIEAEAAAALALAAASQPPPPRPPSQLQARLEESESARLTLEVRVEQLLALLRHFEAERAERLAPVQQAEPARPAAAPQPVPDQAEPAPVAGAAPSGDGDGSCAAAERFRLLEIGEGPPPAPTVPAVAPAVPTPAVGASVPATPSPGEADQPVPRNQYRREMGQRFAAGLYLADPIGELSTPAYWRIFAAEGLRGLYDKGGHGRPRGWYFATSELLERARASLREHPPSGGGTTTRTPRAAPEPCGVEHCDGKWHASYDPAARLGPGVERKTWPCPSAG